MKIPFCGKYELIDKESYFNSSQYNKSTYEHHFNNNFVTIMTVCDQFGKYTGMSHASSVIEHDEWKYFKFISPYRDHASEDDIIADGWSRDFDISQTLYECGCMGFNTTTEYISKTREKLQSEYDA